MIDVSVIIVNYKTPGLIRDCLKTLYQYTKGVTFEVIVVDNDSGDDSEAQVLSAFPDVRWFYMGYNSGFSRASNRGIANAKGRYVFLLNSDTLLVEDVLTRLVKVLDERPDVAAVCPMQITRQGKVHDQLFTKFSQLRRHFFIIPPRPAMMKLLHKLIPDPVYEDPDEVQWLSGACLMTRPSVIEKVGALEESFFMYGEDSEWSNRLGKAGKLLTLRDAFIVHLEYGSQDDYQQPDLTNINRFRTQMHVSNLLWYRKQYGLGAYLFVIFYYIALIPIIYSWKLLQNIKQGKSPFRGYESQHKFVRQLGVFLRFFWPTVFDRKGFYKI